MDLKQWKNFSDSVDKYNKKWDKKLEEIKETKGYGLTHSLTVLNYEQAKVEKTIVNYYEWQIGKLKLK